MREQMPVEHPSPTLSNSKAHDLDSGFVEDAYVDVDIEQTETEFENNNSDNTITHHARAKEVADNLESGKKQHQALKMATTVVAEVVIRAGVSAGVAATGGSLFGPVTNEILDMDMTRRHLANYLGSLLPRGRPNAHYTKTGVT